MSNNNSAAKQLCVSLQVLLTSLDNAESIIRARKTNHASETLERLHSYRNICLEQIKIADGIQTALQEGNWEKVNHDVTLINGLAEMVKEDARTLLGSNTESAIAA